MEACPMTGMLPGGVVVVCSWVVPLCEFWLDVRKMVGCRLIIINVIVVVISSCSSTLSHYAKMDFWCQTRYSTSMEFVKVQV